MARQDVAKEKREARQRILDAALREFGDHGYRGASIRRIARAAGVSPALVQYHFGTKEALRDTCDAEALAWLQNHGREGIEHGRYRDPAYLVEAISSVEPILGYLVTAFASNAGIASTWYDQVQRMMREILGDGGIGPPLSDEDDVEAVSAVLAAMSLGITLFYKEIARVLGTEARPEETMLRVARARLLLSPGSIVGPEFIEQSRAGIDAYASSIDASDQSDGSDRAETSETPVRKHRKAQS